MAENGWVVLTAAAVETLSREGENPLAYLVRHRQVVKVDPRFSAQEERGTFADGSRYSHFRTARGTSLLVISVQEGETLIRLLYEDTP